MSMLVADCPRCGAKSITFDVLAEVYRITYHGWQNWYEIFCVCRQCGCPTTFLVGLILEAYDQRGPFYERGGLVKHEGALNPYFEI